MKLLLDTNILIDYLAERRPYYNAVETLCIAAEFGDVELWVPVQSFLDALYALRKLASQEEIRRAMLASLEFFRPCGMSAIDLVPALESSWPDVEDFMIGQCAKNVDANYLLTRDAKGFVKSKVPAITADDAVNLLGKSGLTYDSVL